MAIAKREQAGDIRSGRIISQRERLWRTFKQNRTAVGGLIIIALIILAAIAAPLLAPYDPLEQSTIDRLEPPSAEHWLGLDNFGRDILSRIIYGTRIALLVGVLSVLFGGTIGTVIGMVAAYKGGRVESVLMRIADILLAFPSLITGLLVLAVLGSGLWKLIIAIGLTILPRFARYSHGPTLSIKNADYIQAARSIGVRDTRMLYLHILPNIVGELLVLSSLYLASAIRLEAALSFIGLGIAPPTPTWGQMIRDGTVYLLNVPWFSIAPGIALLITIMAFNLVGDGLRDILDPRAQGE